MAAGTTESPKDRLDLQSSSGDGSDMRKTLTIQSIPFCQWLVYLLPIVGLIAPIASAAPLKSPSRDRVLV